MSRRRAITLTTPAERIRHTCVRRPAERIRHRCARRPARSQICGLRVNQAVEPHDPRSDAALLQGCRSDASAFAVFYDRYERAVVGYLARRVRDPEVVADLTAEVFAAALQAASRYRPSEPTAAGW